MAVVLVSGMAHNLNLTGPTVGFSRLVLLNWLEACQYLDVYCSNSTNVYMNITLHIRFIGFSSGDSLISLELLLV